MKKIILPMGALLATGLSASAVNLIVNGDFESTTSLTDGWNVASTITDYSSGADLLAGSHSAGLGNPDAIAQDGFDGLSDFTLEFLFRPRFDTADRSLNLILHGGGTTGTGTGSPGLNIKISGSADAGAGSTLQAFDGGWQTIGSANAFTTGGVYRMQITASDWGTASADYDISWSDDGATALTNSVTDLSFFQTDNLSLDRVRFAGVNNSYALDNVVLESIPEPSTTILMGLATLGLGLRRRP